MNGVNAWFSIRIDILAIMVMLCISMICVFYRDYTDPIVLCMLLSYIMTIQVNIIWSLKCYMGL